MKGQISSKACPCAFYTNVYKPVIYQALQNQVVDTLQLTFFSTVSERHCIKDMLLKKLSLQKALGVSPLNVSLKYHFQMQDWLTC